MKLTANTALITCFLLTTISCTKENVISHSSELANSTSKTLSFTIGQRYGGGIIFYIDSTGQHGFIADTVDLPQALWNNPKNNFDTAVGTSKRLGAGYKNTYKIVLALGDSGKYAARECWRSKRSGYTDWFLPSKEELDQLYLQRNVVGGFANTGIADYSSSSEYGASFAFFRNFYTGKLTYYYKGNWPHYYVRAVRAF